MKAVQWSFQRIEEKYLLNHTELKMHHQKYKIKDMNIIIKEEKNKLN